MVKSGSTEQQRFLFLLQIHQNIFLSLIADRLLIALLPVRRRPWPHHRNRPTPSYYYQSSSTYYSPSSHSFWWWWSMPAAAPPLLLLVVLAARLHSRSSSRHHPLPSSAGRAGRGREGCRYRLRRRCHLTCHRRLPRVVVATMIVRLRGAGSRRRVALSSSFLVFFFVVARWCSHSIPPLSRSPPPPNLSFLRSLIHPLPFVLSLYVLSVRPVFRTCSKIPKTHRAQFAHRTPPPP